MKKLILVLFTACLAVVLVACGSDQKADGKEDDKEGTRSYKMVNGKTVEIPKNPQRIVVTEYMGSLSALGIKPLGAASYVLKNPYLDAYKKGVEDIGEPASAEKVAELRPDLIIVAKEDEFEKMQKIAPTILIPYKAFDTIQDELTAIADIVGKQQEAKDWIADFEVTAEKARAKIKDAVGPDATFGLYEGNDKNLYVFADNWGRGGQVLYNALQLKAPEKIQKEVFTGEGYKQISIEVLPEFAADYMFIGQYIPEGSKNEEAIMQSSIWKDLPAYKAKRIFVMDFEQTFYYDPIAIKGQIDLFTDKILSQQ
ncbi:iron ABC transporter substrate-binding protein [Listeria weihenstephanensis FSL R9-0317]|uniref:Iron-hydroxamate ABC transporter substrate-binding protein n=1 Tax=Listeria weihenstephanensis TaxID=1006155 RepID=A0A1S7FTM8_9LIST|nr:iron-hydroxamate ABC transporter substrate-binding protein [Listeria weihenstephanensis]AQY50753.1 hypothetical protein UE46_06695 [Listeria weihenstephanensis]EUJ38448.1 iron ABC transporter substrate-binding protein [Listeria weihenstephanensis FSL R9-0317]MBC1499495.1 iron-hydroxamate ABC transporter substrate-binding protein [Listeria weihenstephanensis]